MRFVAALCLPALLGGCVVADFKTGKLYKPSTYASIQQCNGQSHTRRIMNQNGINEDYMMADCDGIPPYQPAQRLEGR
ncbi:MAG: hypothetical protein GC134_09775 [Proteobacteria bacterium]|nr:hypothetical protein [Pseudomonadota bacterium]